MESHRVKDINPGPGSSSPRELVVVGDALYFRANDGTSGGELWASWGSEYNTQMVHDILPRTTASTIPTGLTPVEHKLFFVASDGMRGLELWSIENAGARPSMVADIARGSAASLIDNEGERRRSETR
jgi:ELWxxDGT repeat protein